MLWLGYDIYVGQSMSIRYLTTLLQPRARLPGGLFVCAQEFLRKFRQANSGQISDL